MAVSPRNWYKPQIQKAKSQGNGGRDENEA